MQLKVFILPIKNLGAAEAEMNAFLRGHRVLAVKKEFVPDGENSFWIFCVEYLDGGGAGALLPGGKLPKVDYKEVLKPEEFEVFSASAAGKHFNSANSPSPHRSVQARLASTQPAVGVGLACCSVGFRLYSAHRGSSGESVPATLCCALLIIRAGTLASASSFRPCPTRWTNPSAPSSPSTVSHPQA